MQEPSESPRYDGISVICYIEGVNSTTAKDFNSFVDPPPLPPHRRGGIFWLSLRSPMSPALECVRPPGMVGSAGREGRSRGRWRRGTARLTSTSSLTEPTMGSAVRVSPGAPLHDMTIMV